MFKVVEARLSDIGNPIRLRKYDRIACFETSDPDGEWPNWVRCMSLRTGIEGWVPKGIIEYSVDYDAFAGAVPMNGIVLQDYDATEFDLEVGDILNAEIELNGWIWCSKRSNGNEAHDNAYGWAPLNHLQKI